MLIYLSKVELTIERHIENVLVEFVSAVSFVFLSIFNEILSLLTSRADILIILGFFVSLVG